MREDHDPHSSETGTKVLYIITSLGTGGAERSLLELMESGLAHNIQPSVVVLERRGFGVTEAVERLPISLYWLEEGPLWRRVAALRRLVREIRPDIVHTSIYQANLMARLALLRLSDTALITSYVNATYEQVRIDHDPNVRRWRLRAVQCIDAATLHLRTDHVHAISEVVAEAVARRLVWPRSKMTVVGRGRDPKRLGVAGPQRRAAVRERYSTGPTTPVLLAVGRREFQKGHRYGLHAMPEILAAHPTAELWIAGRDGNASGELNALAAQLGIEASVKFLGHVSDVPDLIAMADVFLFPSLWEGFGGSLIEAMALECVIVASDIPVIREVVGEPPVALLFDPGQPRALARAVLRALDAPELCRTLTDAAQRRFAEEFTVEQSTARMVALYEDVLARRGRSAGSLPA